MKKNLIIRSLIVLPMVFMVGNAQFQSRTGQFFYRPDGTVEEAQSEAAGAMERLSAAEKMELIEAYLSSLNKKERKKAKKEGGKFLKRSKKQRTWRVLKADVQSRKFRKMLNHNQNFEGYYDKTNEKVIMSGTSLSINKSDVSQEDQDYISQIELVYLADGYFVPLDILNKEINTYPKPKYPADLALNIQFNEPSGNNYLDAEETGNVILTITNNGMGIAYGIQPKIDLKTSIKGLTIGDFSLIENLDPSSSNELKTTISASQNIISKTVEFEINLTEHNGFDLYPPGILTIQTKSFIPPALFLADVGIDDLTNYNGRIEPNEIVEATAIIQNRGQGLAKNVDVVVKYGDNIFNAGDAATSFSLGNIQPNDTRKVRFSFFATRNAETDLPILLEIKETYGLYGKKEDIGLSLNKVIKKATEVFVAGKDQDAIQITEIDAISIDIEKNIPKTGMKNKDAIAVVIGNREYSGDVPSVDFAVRDAEIFKEYLTKTLGYRTGNIFFYTDATFSNMKVAFNKLKNAVKPRKSDVFVYYSGHGAPDPESKQGYFVPVDADPNYIRDTGYPVEDLYKLLNETEAKSITVVIDACFSGASDQGMILKDISPVFIEVKDSFLTSDNSAVFTSATGEQVSSWYRDQKHSLFTYYFLKALQGDADLNADKKLILSEIRDYVDENVPYMARRINNREQTPQLMTDDDTKVLVTY